MKVNVLELIKHQKPLRKKDNGFEVYFCPFCEDNSGHLHLNRKKNFFHCFKCAESGKLDVLQGIKKKDPIAEVRDYDVKKGYNPKELSSLKFSEVMAKFDFEYILPWKARKKKDTPLHVTLSSGVSQSIYDSMKNRDMTELDMQKYRLSHCSDFPFFGRACLFWRPLKSVDPRYMIARRVFSGDPKYLNPQTIKDFLWTSFYLNKVPSKLVITEGFFDMYNVSKVIPSAALLGKSINNNQIEFLLNLRDQGLKEIVIMLDKGIERKSKNSSDGKIKLIENETDATFKIYNKLKDYFTVYPVFLEYAKDPGSAKLDYIAELIGE